MAKFRAISTLLAITVLLACFTLSIGEGGPTDSPTTTSTGPEETEPEALTVAELKKMRVKQLKAMLSDRGVSCIACTEKDELVKKVFESQSLPLIEKKKPPPIADGGLPPDFDIDAIMKQMENKKKQEDELKKRLRESGIDLGNVHFGGSNSMDMDAEQFQKILEKQKRASKKDTPEEAEDEHIEL